MPDHRLIVARAFRVAGAVIGAPSSVAALGLGAGALLTGSGGGQKPDYYDVSTYGIAGLISNAATGVGGVLSFLNGVAAWALGLLAVLALVAALFGGLLYLVGRGLRDSAGWARLLAVAMTAIRASRRITSTWSSQRRNIRWRMAPTCCADDRRLPSAPTRGRHRRTEGRASSRFCVDPQGSQAANERGFQESC